MRYSQPSNMTPQKYIDDWIAKPCKVADVYDEGTLNNVFIGGDDESRKYTLRNYWAINSQEDLTDIEFQAE